jgi:hypothetical protein
MLSKRFLLENLLRSFLESTSETRRLRWEGEEDTEDAGGPRSPCKTRCRSPQCKTQDRMLPWNLRKRDYFIQPE